MSEFDPFEGSSGLTDDVDVTFTECRFIKDPGYVDTESGDMIPVFAVDMHTSHGEVIENQFFSIGRGWEIEDGGAKVVRVEGTKGFNNSSYLQQFLSHMLTLDEGVVRGRYEATGLTPQEAGYWEGLSVHVEQTEYQAGGFRKPKAEWIMRTRLMPTAVHGWNAVKEEKPAPAKKAAAKKKPAAKPEAEATPYQAALASVDSDMVAAIREIADRVQSAEEFIDACYAEIDGLDDSAEAMLLVDDVDGDGTIWMDAVNAS